MSFMKKNQQLNKNHSFNAQLSTSAFLGLRLIRIVIRILFGTTSGSHTFSPLSSQVFQLDIINRIHQSHLIVLRSMPRLLLVEQKASCCQHRQDNDDDHGNQASLASSIYFDDWLFRGVLHHRIRCRRWFFCALLATLALEGGIASTFVELCAFCTSAVVEAEAGAPFICF